LPQYVKKKVQTLFENKRTLGFFQGSNDIYIREKLVFTVSRTKTPSMKSMLISFGFNCAYSISPAPPPPKLRRRQTKPPPEELNKLKLTHRITNRTPSHHRQQDPNTHPFPCPIYHHNNYRKSKN
jgi:hypothetical protein